LTGASGNCLRKSHCAFVSDLSTVILRRSCITLQGFKASRGCSFVCVCAARATACCRVGRHSTSKSRRIKFRRSRLAAVGLFSTTRARIFVVLPRKNNPFARPFLRVEQFLDRLAVVSRGIVIAVGTCLATSCLLLGEAIIRAGVSELSFDVVNFWKFSCSQ
jgi:hypothetical protein